MWYLHTENFNFIKKNHKNYDWLEIIIWEDKEQKKIKELVIKDWLKGRIKKYSHLGQTLCCLMGIADPLSE